MVVVCYEIKQFNCENTAPNKKFGTVWSVLLHLNLETKLCHASSAQILFETGAI